MWAGQACAHSPVVTHGGTSEEKIRDVDIRNAQLAVHLGEPPGGLAEADLAPPPQLGPLVLTPEHGTLKTQLQTGICRPNPLANKKTIPCREIKRLYPFTSGNKQKSVKLLKDSPARFKRVERG
jgi:hypothetical protein